MPSVYPPLFLIVAGFLAPFVPGRLRSGLMLAAPVLGLINLIFMQAGAEASVTVFEYQLVLMRVDTLSLLFGYLFHIAAFIGVLYALHVRDRVQVSTALLYAGSAIGAVFAGDLITLFIYWELLAATSVFLIWARRDKHSFGAGMRYLIMNVLSGLVLLAGILLRVHEGQGIAFTDMAFHTFADAPISSIVILFGIGIKAGFPGLHNWITDGYPAATPTGTVFLSAFTTKVAVYALVRGFAGTDVLVYVGTVMIMFPIFYAVIENNLRRVLCYSMLNQIGFMVIGVGIGTSLAIDGAVAHAFADVLFKGLLFMSMGAILHRTGKIHGSELGNIYKSMPISAGLCMVGAASISAFPLFSAFVTKSMIMFEVARGASEHAHYFIIWLLMLFASAGVVEHAGIKIPYFGFFGHESGIRCKEAPWNMLSAMGIAAILSIAIGVLPATFYRLLPGGATLAGGGAYNPYDLTHVITQTQLLFFSSAAVFTLMLLKIYPPELRSTNLDAEWVYRGLGRRLLQSATVPAGRLALSIQRLILEKIPRAIVGSVDVDGNGGRVPKPLAISSIVLVVTTILLVYLLVYFWTGPGG